MTDDELIEKYIWLPEPTTWPAEARIKGHGQHIWALVGFGQSVNNDPAQIAAGYNLPIEAARAAMAYYQRYRAIFDYRLAENASYFER